MRPDQKLYPPDLARRIWRNEKTRYRPSNGSEGSMFQNRWCATCTKDDYPEGDGCPIIAASMAFGLDDPNYPEEWTFEGGQPCCTAYERDWSKP